MMLSELKRERNSHSAPRIKFRYKWIHNSVAVASRMHLLQ